jgi:DNA repair and recombination protein RAD54B
MDIIKYESHYALISEQNPASAKDPVVKKVLVLCPATLVQNWVQEFKKWLGDERIKVFKFDEGKDLKDFTLSKIYNVLVCGYEKVL